MVQAINAARIGAAAPSTGDTMTDDYIENYKDQPWCHIYGQNAWHSPARIEGTRKALEAIRDAVEVALENGDAETSSLFVTDGEGFHLEVALREFDDLDGNALPYVAPYAGGIGQIGHEREIAAEYQMALARYNSLLRR